MNDFLGMPGARSTARVRVACALAALTIVALLAGFGPFATASGAATAITEPKDNPFVVPLDAQGKPQSFTIVASGFAKGSQVWIEQCDARAVTDPNWAPTRDCDLGSAPAAAIADDAGRARFPAGDPNHGFVPFVGLGPQGLFSCLTPNGPSPHNGLPEYRTCQLRVSSNNNVATSDQVFLKLSFGSTTASTTTTRSSSSKAWVVVVIGAALVVAVLAGAFVFRARRAH